MARSLFSNSPPHSIVIAGRQRRLCVDRRARLVDEAAQVAPAHVHADADVAPAVLAVDRRAARSPRSPRASASSGTVTPPVDRHAQLADLLDVVARRQRQPQHHVEAPLALPVVRHRACRPPRSGRRAGSRPAPCRSGRARARSGFTWICGTSPLLTMPRSATPVTPGDDVLHVLGLLLQRRRGRRRRASRRSARTGR